MAQALLDGESPREFLKRIGKVKPPSSDKIVGNYELTDYGIDNAQYWQGGGIAFTDWDASYTGTGNNAHEAAEDALTQAAMDEWNVANIANEFPEETTADVVHYIAKLARDEASTHLNRDDYATDEEYDAAIAEKAEELQDDDGWTDLQAYVVLYLQEAGTEEPPVQEAAEPGSAREFLRKLKGTPEGWPPFKRWQKVPTGIQQRRAFTTRKDYQGKEYRRLIRNTRFVKYPRPGEYGLRLHQTDVLYYDGQGNVRVNTGGWHTMTTKDRINRFLPRAWRLTSHRGSWVWWNGNWPTEIQNQLWGPRKRGTPRSKYWIPFNDGDQIDSEGKLTFRGGTVTPQGELHFSAPVQEGRYMDQLAWIKRVKAKHEKMKEVRKQERDLENLKKPKTPKWRKRWPIR